MSSVPVLSRGGRISLNLLLVAAALVVVGWVLVRLRLVVLPCLLAVAVATVLWPVVAALRRRRWPPALAAGTVMLAALAAATGVLVALAPSVAEQLDDVGVAAERGVEDVVRWLTEGPLDLSEAQIDDWVDELVGQISGESGAIASGVVSGAVLLGEVLAGLLLAVVLLFFVLKDGPEMRRFCLARVPDGHRNRASAAAEAAWATLGGYLRGVSIVAVVDSVLIGLALLILGVPLVVPLMVLTFVGAFVPLVGAVVAGAVAALVALVAQGPLVALAVVLVVVIIQQVEGDLLYPLVVGRAIDLHPVVVLLTLTAGVVTAGIIGALLAVPATAAGWNAWSAWRSSS